MKYKKSIMFLIIVTVITGSMIILVSEHKQHEQIGFVFLSFSLILSAIMAFLEKKEEVIRK